MTCVVVAGVAGVAGGRHFRTWCQLGGVEVRGADPRLGTTVDEVVRRVIADGHDRVVVDVCTPTYDHADTLRAARDAGAWQFIVEKPAVPSADDWTRLDVELQRPRTIVVENYLFSRAFASLRDAVERYGLVPVRVTSQFDKDRRADSASGRGACASGRLPHVFFVELPHQLYLTRAVLGELDVIAAETEPMVLGDRVLRHHGAGRIQLARGPASADLGSRLDRNGERRFTVSCEDGTAIDLRFTATASTSLLRTADGREAVLYCGGDTTVAPTLSGAMHALAAHAGPSQPVLGDLRRLDAARRMAEGTA